jgi:ADP-ribose pyrophosphatase
MPRTPSDEPIHVMAEGRFLRLVRRGRWEWAERVNTTGAAVIVAVTSGWELVLVEQYRNPLGRRVIELPAGLVGDVAAFREEDMVDAARRELFEETGCEADDIRVLFEGPSSAGLTSETYTLVLARHVRRVAAGGGDESEEIHVHVVPLAEIDAWLEARRGEGLLIDPKIYAGLYFARQ